MPELKDTKTDLKLPERIEKRLKFYLKFVEDIDKQINEKKKTLEEETKNLEKFRKNKVIILLTHDPITRSVVSKLYDKYKNIIEDSVNNLDILVDSGGGDIDATYHLITLFRKMAKKKLTFIVPRWAKSAATMLVCGGDEILMNDTSEIGPLDPQIRIHGGKERLEEEFSPLAINEVTTYINNLINEGKIELAKLLIEKMKLFQLGEYLRVLNISPYYLTKVLKSRMLKVKKIEDINSISEALTKGYPHHGYCILMEDAKELGLNIKKPNKREWKQIWKMWKIHNEIGELLIKKENILKKMMEKIDIEEVLIQVMPVLMKEVF